MFEFFLFFSRRHIQRERPSKLSLFKARKLKNSIGRASINTKIDERKMVMSQ